MLWFQTGGCRRARRMSARHVHGTTVMCFDHRGDRAHSGGLPSCSPSKKVFFVVELSADVRWLRWNPSSTREGPPETRHHPPTHVCGMHIHKHLLRPPRLERQQRQSRCRCRLSSSRSPPPTPSARGTSSRTCTDQCRRPHLYKKKDTRLEKPVQRCLQTGLGCMAHGPSTDGPWLHGACPWLLQADSGLLK